MTDETQLNIDDSSQESEQLENNNEDLSIEPIIDESNDQPKEDKEVDELPLPESDEDEDDGKSDKVPEWVKRKLDKKDKIIARKEAEAELAKKQAEELKQLTLNNETRNNYNNDDQKPDRQDFDSDYDFAAAVYKHQNNLELIEIREKRQQEEALKYEIKFRDNVQEAKDLGENKYADFSEKVNVLFQPSFPSNRAMAEAIVDSEFKHDILYFLGTYEKEARKIAESNPIQAVKKIADLERRFAEKKKNVKKVEKIISPIGIGGGNSAVISDKAPNTLDEYREWYKAKYGR